MWASAKLLCGGVPVGLVCLVKLTADERLSCRDSKLLVIIPLH